jgi:hypothetical protein
MCHEPVEVAPFSAHPAETSLGTGLTPAVESALEQLVDATVPELIQRVSEPKCEHKGEAMCTR